MRSFDVCIEHFLASLDCSYCTESLHVEDYLILELPLLVLIIVIDHQLEILVFT